MKTTVLTLLLLSAPASVLAQAPSPSVVYPNNSQNYLVTSPTQASTSQASTSQTGVAPTTLDMANQAQIQQAQLQQAELQQDQIQQTEYPGGPATSLPALPGQAVPATPVASETQTPQPPKRPPVEGMNDEEKLLWAHDPKQVVRQEGRRIEQPLARGLYHSASLADKELLQAWTYHLMNEGIPETKIIFEAKRLNKEEFQRWASRFVWWEEGLHPNTVRQHP